MNAVVVLVFVLFWAVGPDPVWGLPSGAPSSACSSLAPNPDRHLAQPMDEDTLPHVLNISNLSLDDGDGDEYGYKPGEVYFCRLYPLCKCVEHNYSLNWLEGMQLGDGKRDIESTLVARAIIVWQLLSWIHGKVYFVMQGPIKSPMILLISR